MDDVYAVLITDRLPGRAHRRAASHAPTRCAPCSSAPVATSPPRSSRPASRARSRSARVHGARRVRISRGLSDQVAAGNARPFLGGVAQPGRALRSQRRSRGFKSHHLHRVMSRDIEDGPNPQCGFGSFLFGGGWGLGFAGGLVVAGGVDGEVAEEFAGGGVDDADVEVVDEDDDVGSGVGSADADVVEPAVDAEGDGAGGVDRGRGGRGEWVSSRRSGWLWVERCRRWRVSRGAGAPGGVVGWL